VPDVVEARHLVEKRVGALQRRTPQHRQALFAQLLIDATSFANTSAPYRASGIFSALR
jgi:hypothetical protein